MVNKGIFFLIFTFLLSCGAEEKTKSINSNNNSTINPNKGKPETDKKKDRKIPTQNISINENQVPQYFEGLNHSPINNFLIERWKNIRSKGKNLNKNYFSKIGASATKSKSFMHCFDSNFVKFGQFNKLEETRQFFLSGNAGGSSPFKRESLCSVSGWSAFKALDGDPSPVKKEFNSVRPQYAFIMYGTNDMGFKKPFRYAQNLLDLADFFLDRGSIPIFSNVMPRDDKPAMDLWVPRVNAIVKAVSQAKGVPFIDFHRELNKLSNHGLAGDKLHPSSYKTKLGYRTCDFEKEGLKFGYNIRNLFSIQSIHRLVNAINGKLDLSKENLHYLKGLGTKDNPFLIENLPFSHFYNTTKGSNLISQYTGCKAKQNESGKEIYYQVSLKEKGHYRLFVFNKDSVDTDIHILKGNPNSGSCIKRAHEETLTEVPSGKSYISLDSFVDKNGHSKEGEYLFLMLKKETSP